MSTYFELSAVNEKTPHIAVSEYFSFGADTSRDFIAYVRYILQSEFSYDGMYHIPLKITPELIIEIQEKTKDFEHDVDWFKFIKNTEGYVFDNDFLDDFCNWLKSNMGLFLVYRVI